MNYTPTYNIPILPLKKDFETKEVLKKLNSTYSAISLLNGITKLIPQPEILINSLSLQEAKDSSEIENIITTYDDLYKADMKIGNLTKEAKEVQDYKIALLQGFEFIKKYDFLALNHIISIQKTLEHNETGIRKIPGTILKNDISGEIVYVPPQEFEQIVKYLENLEKYINNENQEDILIKLAVIHHQFESIHPFHDGNGRTGRIINILFLVLKKILDLPILYLSGYIIKNKNKYYHLLQKVRDEDSWQEWILFILDGIEKTSNATTNIIQNIWEAMGQTKRLMKENTSFYSKDFLELIYKHPYTKIDFVVKELNITRQTASKYLSKLVELEILEKMNIGKENYYINVKLYNLLKKGINF